MDATPNDSGASHVEVEGATDLNEPSSGLRLPSSDQVRAEIRRPAVWGLLLLIAAVLVLQLWLLF
jgi:hypothetical protein